MLKHAHLPIILVGSLSTLAGVGLSRFAYTPLLPALVEQNWFSAEQAAYLGAANLLGYLIGALLAHSLASRLGAARVLRVSIMSIAASFALCALTPAFTWFFAARLISGVAGASLMVIGPSLALARTPAALRSRVGPLLFTGIGLGALLSACVMPALLAYPLSLSWFALTLLTLLGAALLHYALEHLPPPDSSAAQDTPTRLTRPLQWLIALVLAAYALDAAGFIPHTLFWVDFLVRQQGVGAPAAALQWALFGLGAVCGPFIAAALVQLMGCAKALVGAYVLKALAVALPLLSLTLFAQSASSFVVGALTPGIVSLTSTRIAQCVSPAQHRQIWGWATAAFALSQAGAGYAMALLYSLYASYTPLFALGAICLICGAVLLGCSFLYAPRSHTR